MESLYLYNFLFVYPAPPSPEGLRRSIYITFLLYTLPLLSQKVWMLVFVEVWISIYSHSVFREDESLMFNNVFLDLVSSLPRKGIITVA